MMNAHAPPPVGTRESYESEFKYELARVRYAVALEQPHYGWPVVCYQPNELWIKYPQEEEGEERPLLWNAHGFILDCCVAIGFLLALVAVAEFIIRRGKARKHRPKNSDVLTAVSGTKAAIGFSE